MSSTIHVAMNYENDSGRRRLNEKNQIKTVFRAVTRLFRCRHPFERKIANLYGNLGGETIRVFVRIRPAPHAHVLRSVIVSVRSQADGARQTDFD